MHDDKGCKIHMSIPKHLVKTIGLKMIEGKVYKIHNFYVLPNHMVHKTTNHQFRLIANDMTEFFEVKNYLFPSYMFSFKPIGAIQTIESVDTAVLFDIIGIVKGIGKVSTEGYSKHLELLIEDEVYNEVYCTLKDSMVDTFLQKLDKKMKKLPIIILQFCKPIISKDGIRITTTHPYSRVVFNEGIKEINEFRERILGDGTLFSNIPIFLGEKTDDDDEDVLNEITSSITSLSNFFVTELLLNFFEMRGAYWICAKVEKFNGLWYSMKCKSCNKNVVNLNKKFYCENCHRDDESPRFMFRIEVFDGSCTTQLLLWEKELLHLIENNSGEMNIGMNEVELSIPNEVQASLFGKVVLFKIEGRNEADMKLDHPYTCTTVCTLPHIVEKFSVMNLHPVNLRTTFLENGSTLYVEEDVNECMITDLADLECFPNVSESAFLIPKVANDESDAEFDWINYVFGEDEEWTTSTSAKRKFEDDMNKDVFAVEEESIDFNVCDNEKKKGKFLAEAENEG